MCLVTFHFFCFSGYPQGLLDGLGALFGASLVAFEWLFGAFAPNHFCRMSFLRNLKAPAGMTIRRSGFLCQITHVYQPPSYSTYRQIMRNFGPRLMEITLKAPDIIEKTKK